jgi:hypothetical protein
MRFRLLAGLLRCAVGERLANLVSYTYCSYVLPVVPIGMH